ncbi:MAG: hypothetical protein JWN78_58 [Bacteroidota bacterium]|nr:hypothetical protein [Bacteroidota bacterium]
MPDNFYKYSLKFIFCTFSFVTIISCVPKHKFDFDKNKLSDKKMTSILTDIFLMESYVNEKMQGHYPDSITSIKMSFYKKILEYHKVDSVTFYTTFNYLQAHPKDFLAILKLTDSTMHKIVPLDTIRTAPYVSVPKNIEKLPNFNEQEKAMREEFIKKKLEERKQESNKDKNK